jgi:hypothetical protein
MKAEKKSYSGITVQDVLDLFPGARIVATDKPQSCAHCSNDHVPEWRRGGKIVQPDLAGRPDGMVLPLLWAPGVTK